MRWTPSDDDDDDVPNEVSTRVKAPSCHRACRTMKINTTTMDPEEEHVSETSEDEEQRLEVCVCVCVCVSYPSLAASFSLLNLCLLNLSLARQEYAS
jgi:hypothetical protein